MNYAVFARFGKTKTALVIAFLWGLAEGLVFFVVPDVYVGFVAIFSASAGLSALVFSVIGSLVSAVVVFLVTPLLGKNLNHLLLHIPGISEKMIQGVVHALQTNGFLSLINAPLSGVPYKIYSVNAALQHFPLFQYLLWSIPSRLERILPVTIVALILGRLFKKNILAFTTIWIVGYALLWVIIYIFYYHSLS